MDPKQMADSTGVTYEDYLQMLLMIGNQDELTMRALDLVEIQMRYVTANDVFKIDNCVAVLEATVNAHSEPVFFSMPFMQQFLYSGVDLKVQGTCDLTNK